MSKKLILFSLFCFSILTFCSIPSFAQVPNQLPYQGVLTDKNDVALNGSYNLTFRIYDALTGGNLLWSESQTGINIEKGLFSVSLGKITTLNLAFDKTYWLSIQVNSDGEMSPRQQLASVPYARRAAAVEGGGSSSWDVPGTLQWETGKVVGMTGQDVTVPFATPFKQAPIVLAGIGGAPNEVQVLTFETRKDQVRFARLPSSGFTSDICWLALDRAAFTIENDPLNSNDDIAFETFRGWTTYPSTTDSNILAFSPQRNLEPAIALALPDSGSAQYGAHLIVSNTISGDPSPGKGFAYRQNTPSTSANSGGNFIMAMLIKSGQGNFGPGVSYEAGYKYTTGNPIHLDFTHAYTNPLIFLTPARNIVDSTPTSFTAWYNNLTPTGVDLYMTSASNSRIIFYMVIEKQTGVQYTSGFHHLRIGE